MQKSESGFSVCFPVRVNTPTQNDVAITMLTACKHIGFIGSFTFIGVLHLDVSERGCLSFWLCNGHVTCPEGFFFTQ